ncbi:MAG: alpha-amylase family glycosyl hydrolase [Acutalibacteraceae bacterium]
MIKKLLASVLTVVMLASLICIHTGAVYIPAEEEAAADYGLKSNVQEGVILHAWNWSYNNIKANMKTIAESGYSAVQTSPVTQPKDYYWEGVAYGDVGIPDGTGGYNANWWKVYQPVSMSICDNGNTWFGTKKEFEEMCAEAEKYGVKVIVDIVANHMGNIQGWKIGSVEEVMSDISPQVGEFCNPDMLTDPSYWHISTSWIHSSDGRFDITQGNMGMPDLNTGDKKVQTMVLNLLKECIDAGADGFRFDAAKHIETPADDPAFASDFWDVVLDGATAYAKSKGLDAPYYYGEVLNRLDSTAAENYYISKMSLTDNSTGDNIRNSLRWGGMGSAGNSGFAGYVHGKADRVVLWAESHDTYMGGGSSYDANDKTIKQTWAVVASRKDATSLFFARPYYSKQILADDVNGARQPDYLKANLEQRQMGEVGTYTWSDTSVAEVNKFHNLFAGQSESLSTVDNKIFYNERGTSGVIIVNLDGAGEVSLSAKAMKAGTYKDQVTGEIFTVANGKITGNIKGEDGIAVVYDADPAPQNTISQKGGEFTSDTLKLTLGLSNATSGTYKIGDGAATTYTASTEITIGEGLATGESVTVYLTATNGSETTNTSYTFTKTENITPTTPTSPTEPTTPTSPTGPTSPTQPAGTVKVYFDNSKTNWDKVCCYIYADGAGEVKAWPGNEMTLNADGLYEFTVPSGFENGRVLFNNKNNGQQIPAAGQPGLEINSKNMIYQNGSWKEYIVVEPTEPTDPTQPEQYMYGDLTGDSVVDMNDVLHAQRYLAKIATFTQPQILSGDINKSGDIDLQDILEVQKYMAKIKCSELIGTKFSVA